MIYLKLINQKNIHHQQNNITEQDYSLKHQRTETSLHKFKKTIPVLISVSLLIGLVATTHLKSDNSKSNKENFNKAKETFATADTAENKEMRGVWVSYIELSMENETNKSENSFRKKFTDITKKCKNNGFNTLIVQVRPFSDALYKSDYYPASHILSGEQGKYPDYDALKIMSEICRANNMKIHAWVNPYRISSNNTPSQFSSNNPYKTNAEICKTTENGIFLDPSSYQTLELIINGIKEIAENYDIDGIQFDDYFYPTTDSAFDENEYNKYVESVGIENSMTLENWRKANVNMLICDTYKAIHNINKNIEFGISPQGNLNNNESLYAEVKAWCSCKGFIDYICPQIYFSLENPALSFKNCLESWSNLEYADGVKLYIGLAGYKAGTNEDDGTWVNNNDILSQEYNIITENEKAEGIMLYSYQSLINDESSDEIANLKKALN